MLIMALLVSGCAGNLKQKATFYSDVETEQRALKIYETAKECWTRKPTLVVKGVVVSSIVSLEDVRVEARFDDLMTSKIEEPFVKITVQKNSNGSYSSVHSRWPFVEYEKAAKRWAMGDYSCEN